MGDIAIVYVSWLNSMKGKMLPPVNVPVYGVLWNGGVRVSHIPGLCRSYPLTTEAVPKLVPLGNSAIMFKLAACEGGTYSNMPVKVSDALDLVRVTRSYLCRSMPVFESLMYLM